VVREAFRVLEHAGLVEGRQGSRRYLVGSSVVFGSRLISMEKELTTDLLEARRVFEIPIVRLAAVRRDEHDAAKLTEMRLTRPVVFEGHEEMRADDMNLHLALAAATHNKVLYSMQEHINRIRAVRLSITVSVEARLAFRRFQIPMVQAVVNRDPDGAAAALEAHYRVYEEVLAVAPEFRTAPAAAANSPD
jgi:GntR family transcriptional repressor for pyruvate dehydrogenase complex